MSDEHTPTPWTTDDFSVRGAVTQSGVSPWLFDVYGSEGDAEFIVRCVNAHDGLVAALTLVQRGIRRGAIKDQSIIPSAQPDATHVDVVSLSSIIDVALAKAEARS